MGLNLTLLEKIQDVQGCFRLEYCIACLWDCKRGLICEGKMLILPHLKLIVFKPEAGLPGMSLS